MGAETSSLQDADEGTHIEPVHYVLRHGVYVRHLGDAREHWPPSSSVFRSQAPPALERADILTAPGSLRHKTLSIVPGERTIQLKADVDAQAPIRVLLNFDSEERGQDDGIGLGLADAGIWLPAGMQQPWKGKPFRASKYAAPDGSFNLTIEVKSAHSDDGENQPEEHTQLRFVPRGPDEKPGYDLEVKRQYVRLGDAEYDLLELYGQAGGVRAKAPVGQEPEFGGDLACVICLIEERDTAILPCRHLCLCSSCAEVMRLRSQTCPICRQSIKSLLQVDSGPPDPRQSMQSATSLKMTPRTSFTSNVSSMRG